MKLYYFIKREIIKQTILNLLFVRIRCKNAFLGGVGTGFKICPEVLTPRDTSNHHTGKQDVLCYSAGVGDNISFDILLHEQFQIDKLFLFDPTPLTIEWIKSQKLPVGFEFFPYGIAGTTEKVPFYLSPSEEASSSASSSMFAEGNRHVSKDKIIKIDVKSLKDISEQHTHQFVDLLKMDIEGSEFSVIESFQEDESPQFGQICVEFHQRFFRNQWRVLFRAVHKLSRCGYKCFAVNWNIMEFSFVNVKVLKNARKIKKNPVT